MDFAALLAATSAFLVSGTLPMAGVASAVSVADGADGKVSRVAVTYRKSD